MPAESWAYVLSVDGRDIELSDGEVTLGRSRTSTVRVDHESVSRSHALITFDRGNAVVKDLNSSNGTYVGGRRVLNETKLMDGDRIQLGAAVVGFRVVPPQGPSERTAMMDPKLAMVAPPSVSSPSFPARESGVRPAMAVVQPPKAAVEPVPPSPVEISADELLQHRNEAVGAPASRPAAAGPALEAVRTSTPDTPATAASPSLATERETRPGTVVEPPPREPEPLAALPPPPPPPPPLPAPSPAPRRETPRRASQAAIKPEPRDAALAEMPLRPAASAIAAGSPDLPVAGFFVRFAALLVDQVILTALDLVLISPFFLVSFFLRGDATPGESGGKEWIVPAVAIVCSILVIAVNLYYVVGGWARTGRTPGKSLLGLMVVDANGGRGIGWKAAVVRLLGMMVSALPLSAGFIVVLFRADRRGWHDLIAKTWVVRTR